VEKTIILGYNKKNLPTEEKMKKILFVVALLILVFAAGCTPQDINSTDPLDVAIVEEINTWILSQIPNQINEDLILPTTHPSLGGIITWTSFDEDILTEDGFILSSDAKSEAMLSYKIVYQTATKIDYLTINVLTKTLDDVALDFSNQFAVVISRDYNVVTEYYDSFTVSWSSSNQDVFSNEGKFTRPEKDTTIIISYTVNFGNTSKDYTHEVRVQGMLLSDKIREVNTWITQNYLPSRLIESEVNLPNVYPRFNAPITWSSSNYNVIDDNGKVTRYPFDRYVTLTAKINLDGLSSYADYSLVIAKKAITNQEEKINSFLKAIAVEKLPKVTFEYYSNITQSYNFLPFFNVLSTPITEKLSNNANTRSYTKMTSVEFITIHDTAATPAGANALMHANYLINGAEGRYVSWHFAVDQDGAYQSVPLDEVSWHAGDGSLVFKLNKTNVLATTKYPVLGISTDGYFTFNGQKSNIKAPLAGTRLATTSDITPSGIYTEVGSDGYYYINSTHWDSTYAKIAQNGGNRNSISFETCVNAGSDYFLTARHTANITSDLLILHNLSVDRITQHNNYSGKDCPLTIRRTGYWNNFLDLVSLLKYGKENFSNYTFTWTSTSPNLLANGQILRSATVGSSLNYSVEVRSKTNSLEVYNKSFTTILK